MGQLTIQRFRGDTVFGTSARIVSTFFGGIVGMVMWYVYLLRFISLFCNELVVDVLLFKVHFVRQWTRKCIWARSSLCSLFPILLLCEALLAHSSDA